MEFQDLLLLKGILLDQLFILRILQGHLEVECRYLGVLAADLVQQLLLLSLIGF